MVQKVVSLGRSFLKLVQKMVEFMLKLFVRDREKGDLVRRVNFLKVEVVAAVNGFVIDGFEVEIQGPDRIGCVAEADELGVAGVAFCLSQQDFPGEQAFPPQGDQADGIQIGWVNGPEPHEFLDWPKACCVDFPCFYFSVTVNMSQESGGLPGNDPGKGDVRVRPGRFLPECL